MKKFEWGTAYIYNFDEILDELEFTKDRQKRDEVLSQFKITKEWIQFGHVKTVKGLMGDDYNGDPDTIFVIESVKDQLMKKYSKEETA